LVYSASDELLIVKAAISVVAFTQPPPKNKKKPLSTCFGYPQAGNPSYKCNVSVERGADIAVDRSGPSLSCHITQTSAVDYVQHGIKVTAKDRATINPSNRNDKNPIRKLWVLELNQLSAKKKFDIRESLSESEVPSWARMLTHDCGVTWKLPTNLLSKDGLFVLIQAYVTARERKKPFLHDVICKVRTFETKFKLTAVEKSNYLIVHCIPRQPVTTSYKATKAWSFKTRRNVAMNETVWRWTDEKKEEFENKLALLLPELRKDQYTQEFKSLAEHTIPDFKQMNETDQYFYFIKSQRKPDDFQNEDLSDLLYFEEDQNAKPEQQSDIYKQLFNLVSLYLDM